MRHPRLSVPAVSRCLPLVAFVVAVGSPVKLTGQLRAGAAVGVARAVALATYEQGQAMMADAVKNLAVEVGFKFLDKTYENDVYVKEPITGKKVRTACVRFKTTSGFAFKTDPPTYQLSTQGLVLTENIAKIEAQALDFKFQLGPCAYIGAGFGVKLRDVKLTYKARPTIKFANGGCQVSLNAMPSETRVSIGDLNITGVQNDIDKLAKDAAREALNATLENFFNSGLGSGLAKAAITVCGGPKKG
jgi:hypothetical protein